MPSADTFDIQPIAVLLQRVLAGCEVIIDPFARNSTLGTIRNDLNPNTSAQYHMDAIDFVETLTLQGVRADAVLFDPPYSPRQIAEVYQSIGRRMTQQDGQNSHMYRRVKAGLSWLLRHGGLAICFGWNSGGFGGPLFQMDEVLIVPHGGAHNDTIVTVERKIQSMLEFGSALDAVDPVGAHAVADQRPRATDYSAVGGSSPKGE